MRDKLILYLHAQDLTHPSWVVMTSAEIISQSALNDEAEGLALIAEDKEIIVVVPAEDVVLTTCTLPKMNRSRLQQALPFALEDQLVAEVEKLHFVAGPRQEDESLPVAIVAHEKMRAWLDQLAAWKIQADVIIPLTLALPYRPQSWFMILHEIAVVRTGFYQGFACELSQLKTWLEASLKNLTLRPEFLYATQYGDQLKIKELEALPIPVQFTQKEPELFIKDIAQNLVTIPINLLQGIYTPKKPAFSQFKKLRQVTMGLGLGCLFLLLLYPTVSYLLLQHRVAALDAQIAQIYRHHFADATTIMAPKLRMQEKLQQTTTQMGDNHFLAILANVAHALNTIKGINVKRLDFQNNQFTLELSAASSDDFANFSDLLSQAGLSVKQQNATLAGTRINATLVIE